MKIISFRKKKNDDNIHKSEALKSERKDKQTITLVECQNLISKTFIPKYKQKCT